jgi:hypothetical protein
MYLYRMDSVSLKLALELILEWRNSSTSNADILVCNLRYSKFINEVTVYLFYDNVVYNVSSVPLL